MKSTDIIAKKRFLRQKLLEINAVQRGQFTLRSGVTSSVYIDLRSTVSYPVILRAIADVLWDSIKVLKPRLICGVPYTALPMAVCMALDHNLPLLICRKEVKNYGTGKQVEGVFNRGDNCLVIEDVMTTGSSVLNIARTLKEEGLCVTDVAVLVDREQGGSKALQEHGYRLHPVFTLSELDMKK